MSALTVVHVLRCLRPLIGAVRATVGLVVGCTVVVVTVALIALTLLPHLGARGLVVTSGSMEPAIPTGALTVVRAVDAVAIEPGDVITYTGYTASGLTTHRVVRPVDVGGRLHFQTKGDANVAPDPDLAPADGTLGRVDLIVPHAGRVLSLLNDPAMRFLALGLPAVWFFVRSLADTAAALRARGRRAEPHGTSVVAVAVLAAAASLAHRFHAEAVTALLTDLGTIPQNMFSTGTWT